MEPYYKTFVSVGNGKQSFIRLLKAVEALADILPAPILVQCGHTSFSSQKFDVVDFVNMDNFVKYIADASMLILHAGAGSVSHAIKAKKRPILMPRKEKFDEIVNDHQVAFAKTFHLANKAIMVENEYELKLAIDKIKKEGINLPYDVYTSKALDVIQKKLQDIFSNE